ncbi:hypothetical protein NZK35_21715 [Stieleria sp. ICT_E10.1]|uniref:hypothetical protein n=1 Tax=Stieleria sedimenti TaxID=2976331 RepID=UPI00217FB474|nr:hypothetical protein [Stieleria sedimenti]MCS7469276.1 hypothetical protein [Stieleria sedimenti]
MSETKNSARGERTSGETGGDEQKTDEQRTTANTATGKPNAVKRLFAVFSKRLPAGRKPSASPSSPEHPSVDSRRLEEKALPPSGTPRRQSRARWIASAVVLSMLVAANWPFQYSVSYSTQATWSELPFDFGFRTEDGLQAIDPVEAGWPFRYYIRHPFPNGPDQVQWYGGALAWNLAIALVFLAIIWFYLRPSVRKSNRVSLADLLFVVTLIASAMGYWRWLIRQSEADQVVADQLATSGQVLRQSYMPAILTDWVPESARTIWLRTTAVDLQEPSDEQLQWMCKLPYLRALRIGGGQYDQKPLSRLPSMRYLQDLRVAGTELDAETVFALSECSLLRQLNISHTNLAEDALQRFAKLPQLSRLMAMETVIPFQAWQNCELKNQLEILVLSRPKTGTAGEIRLESWPQLRRLAFQSLDEPLNPSLFEISVHDMPELEYFGFDSFQLVDLDLQRLPKLANIKVQYHNLQTRMADNDQMPVEAWVRNCTLKEIPLIESFSFYVRDFETIQVEGCDAMEHLAGTSMIVPGVGDPDYDPTISSECSQRVIDQFGKLNGPSLLRLRGCDLRKVDFSPLTENPAIASLDFQYCALAKQAADQIAKLSATSIDVRNAEVGVGFVNSISAQVADLKSLLINSNINALRVENQPELEMIVFDQHKKSQITALRLINVPELRTPLVLSPVGNYLHVEAAPQLPGLAVLSPLSKIRISGVAGLEWFIGGGEGMTDENVSEVLKARALTKLTIAYPSASSKVLNDVSHLRSLEQLALPGADLDNDVFQQWDIPATLTELDLRDCGLSAATTSRIISRGGWTQLLLGGNEIDMSSLPELRKSPGLTAVSLGGVTINQSVIDAMGPLDYLSQVKLVGATIEPGGLSAIIDKSDFLNELDLTGATADWSEIVPALRTHPSLMFRLSPVDATVALITKLTAENRLIMERDAYETWFQPQERKLLGYDPRGFAVYADPDDEEGPSEFERPDWAPDFFRPAPKINSPAGTVLVPNAPVGPGARSVLGQLLRSINSAGASVDDTDNLEDVEEQ